MVDQAKLWIRAGNGGNGAVSFRREKFIPKGGPDGGNGGKGGDIYLEADTNMNTLDDFAHRQKFEATDGGKGRGKKMSGAKGDDLIIKVPLGTVVKLKQFSVLSSQMTDGDGDEKVIDFDRKGMRVLVAKGGAGGRGNEHFKSASNTTPMTAEPGQMGEKYDVEMSLKLLADVGLVGLPNAGKSTLLSVLSNARPKVADYEFTTLEPNLGVLRLRAGASPAPTGQDRSLVIADIPGLIEGASEGKGLGTKFLKHIERTRVIVHLVAVEDLQGQALQVWENYQKIRKELKNYGGGIDKKKEIVVLSKIDLIAGKTQKIKNSKIQEIKEYFKKKKIDILPISSGNGQGLAELRLRITSLSTG